MATIDDALALARKGFSVFPVRPNASAPPLLKGFVEKATTDETVISTWWARFPMANVGVSTRGLVVLDVDPRKGGRVSYRALVAELGGLPSTFRVKTPSGGFHVYYRCADRVKNRVGWRPGIDLRSEGGYVVGPGSVRPDGRYVADDEAAAIQDAPTNLARLLPFYDAFELERVGPVVSDAEIDAGLAATRAGQWLKTARVAVEGQGGDAWTYEVACRVRDYGVPEVMALEVLEEWNSRCEPPWNLEELKVKVGNAYAYAQGELGSLAERMFSPSEPRPAPIQKYEDLQLYSPAEVDGASVLETHYLVKGWLHESTHALMFGRWGDGKTFIALDLAARISTGQEWFGHRVRPGGVLAWMYEGAAMLRRRAYALARRHPDQDLSRFMIRPATWPLARRNAGDALLKGQQELKTALEVFKSRAGAYPKLIVIDPLRNALGGSDSDPELTAMYIAFCQEVIWRTGSAVLTLHHPGHSEPDRGRGDSAIEAHMDAVIRVNRELGSIAATKQRDERPGEVFYRLSTVRLGEDADGDEVTTCVVDAVEANPMSKDLTDIQYQVLQGLIQVAQGGHFSKTLFNEVAAGLSSEAKADTWTWLVKKRFVYKDGRSWRIDDSAGPSSIGDVL